MGIQKLVWKYSQRGMQRLVLKYSQLQWQRPRFPIGLLLLQQYNRLQRKLPQFPIGLLLLQACWLLLSLFLFAISPSWFIIPGFCSPGLNFCLVHLVWSPLLYLSSLSKTLKICQCMKGFLRQMILMSKGAIIVWVYRIQYSDLLVSVWVLLNNLFYLYAYGSCFFGFLAF